MKCSNCLFETGGQVRHEQVDQKQTDKMKTVAGARGSKAAQMGREEAAFMQEEEGGDSETQVENRQVWRWGGAWDPATLTANKDSGADK